RHRALNMLKLIYSMFNVKPEGTEAPSDKDFLKLVGKEAGIRVRETPPGDNDRIYNWVSEVHPSDGFVCETGISVVRVHKATPVSSSVPQSLEEDVPW